MPHVAELSYFLELFMRAGRVHSGGMSITPLSYSELRDMAWVEGLKPQEARVLRSMTLSYMEGVRRAKNDFALPPWDHRSDL